MELNGTTFNEKFKDKIFYKLTNRQEKHNGHEYTDGLNVDAVKFEPTENCHGGIYFTEYDNIYLWIKYRYELMYYYRKIEIPSDASVYVEENKSKIKTNKIILKEKKEIWTDYELCKKMVQQDGIILQYVKSHIQTPELIELAVSQNGLVLQFVHSTSRSSKLNEIAVRQNGLALEFVIWQNPLICELAVMQNGNALKYSKHKSVRICKLALKQNGRALKFMKHQTRELCALAIKQDKNAVEFVNAKLLKWFM